MYAGLVLDGVGIDSLLVSVGRVNELVGADLVLFQIGVLDDAGGP